MEGRGYGDGDEIEDEKTNAESRRRGGTKRRYEMWQDEMRSSDDPESKR